MKKTKTIVSILLSIGILYAGFIFTLIVSACNDQPVKHADSLIILGAQVRPNPTRPSPVLKERLDTALLYLQDNPETKIITCGGKGSDEPDSEANVMADYLIQNGVDEKRIVREDASTRTMENLKNAKEKTNLGKTVIVSNEFHMYRSKLLAKRIGIKQVTGLPAHSKTTAKYITYTREVLALGYGLLFDWS